MRHLFLIERIDGTSQNYNNIFPNQPGTPVIEDAPINENIMNKEQLMLKSIEKELLYMKHKCKDKVQKCNNNHNRAWSSLNCFICPFFVQTTNLSFLSEIYPGIKNCFKQLSTNTTTDFGSHWKLLCNELRDLIPTSFFF